MSKISWVCTLLITAYGLASPAQTITSTTDKTGNQHPATAAVRGPSTVTCTQAIGNDPRNYPPACSITAPGYSGSVNPGTSVGTSGAGTVTLTCNGQAPLRCSARIGSRSSLQRTVAQVQRPIKPGGPCAGKGNIKTYDIPQQGSSITEAVGANGVIGCNFAEQANHQPNKCHIETVHSGTKDLAGKETMGIAVTDTFTFTCPGTAPTHCGLAVCY